jgi:hypothetical protein
MLKCDGNQSSLRFHTKSATKQQAIPVISTGHYRLSMLVSRTLREKKLMPSPPPEVSLRPSMAVMKTSGRSVFDSDHKRRIT